MSQGARDLRISNMRPVLSAKVPIIKFVVDRRFEADLSFSNYLVSFFLLCFNVAAAPS